MTDNQFGVYISIRNTDGVLVSSSRATAQEVMDDIPGLMEILERWSGESPESPKPITEEVTSPATPDFHNAAEMTPEQVAAGLARVESYTTVSESAAPATTASQFQTCSKCGSVKDKWVPPGVSKKTNRPYPGFFGCSNPNCR